MLTPLSEKYAYQSHHTAGLDHPWENRDGVEDINQNSPTVTERTIKDNLINSDQNSNVKLRSSSGTKLTPGQYRKLDETIVRQQP